MEKPSYTDKELQSIAASLNRLVKVSKGVALSYMGVFFFEHYYNEKRYVDYNRDLKEFRVYKRYPGFKAPEFKLNLN